MPGLMDLPREVRDAIIECVLLSRNKTDPNAPKSFEQLYDVPYKSWLRAKGVFHHPETKQPNVVPLLLVSRQICAETQDAVARLPHKGSFCSVDVVFFQEKQLYVHWTCVPLKTTHFDTVNVRVQIDDHIVDDEGGYGRNNVWKGADGGPPAIYWLWYSALERLLKAGPVGKQLWPNSSPPYTESGKPKKDASSTLDRRVTIQHLIVDFVSPLDDSTLAEDTKEGYQLWRGARTGYWSQRAHGGEGTREAYRNKVMRPEWLADYLIPMFRGLLRQGRHTKNYGAMMYERIGDVAFCIDGRVTEKLDLAEWLSDNIHHPGQYSMPEQPIRDFNDWKARVYLHRQEVGLPVVSFTQRSLEDMGRESQPQAEEYQPGRRVEDFQWGY